MEQKQIMDTKKYIIFDISEVDKINFDEVLESSKDTLRLSLDNKSFVKYYDEMPESIKILESKSQEYSYEKILDILEAENWNIKINSITGNT